MPTILLIIGAIEQLADAYGKIKNDLQQSGQLTDDQVKELDNRMAVAFQSPAWKPDSGS